jgi:hypothetical protein
MTESDYEYLDSCPVILHLPFLNNSVIVHAGLDPNIPLLQDQIPYLVMNMRDIDSNNNPTPESGVGTQWSTKWNSAQSQLTVNNTNIYYGHDAGRGLNLKDYTFGLDSGCVYGDKLTAIEMKTHALKQVQCAKYASNTDD